MVLILTVNRVMSLWLDQSVGLSHLLTIWIPGCGFGESLTTGYNSAIVILSISWNMFNAEGQQAFKNSGTRMVNLVQVLNLDQY